MLHDSRERKGWERKVAPPRLPRAGQLYLIKNLSHGHDPQLPGAIARNHWNTRAAKRDAVCQRRRGAGKRARSIVVLKLKGKDHERVQPLVGKIALPSLIDGVLLPQPAIVAESKESTPQLRRAEERSRR